MESQGKLLRSQLDARAVLHKVASGDHGTSIDKKQIYEYNYPNYAWDDVIVDNLHFKFTPFLSELNGNKASVTGTCHFSPNSGIPELGWDHISGTIYMIVITQAGKASQNYCSTMNGGALRNIEGSIKKQAPLRDISFAFESDVFVKRGALWIRSMWNFYHQKNKVAHFDVLSFGIERDYSRLEKKKRETSSEE